MVMKMNNLNASSFADKVGVQRSSVSHILSGRNKPSLDFIQKTLNTFPRVSGDWLISGKQPTKEEMDNQPSTETKTKERKDFPSRSAEPVKQKNTTLKKAVDKIVYFYKDGSFKEYFPFNEE